MNQFAVMTISDAAVARICEIMASHHGAHGVRIGVKKGGCAGMEYTIDLVTEMRSGDDIIEKDGAKIYVAPEAALFLLGTEMDYEITKLRAGFIFHNPNQISACGCGESVELTPANPEDFLQMQRI